MCGIAALFALKAKPFSSSLIQQMTTIIRHRGPDDEGYFLLKNDQEKVILSGRDTPERVFNSTIPYCPKQSFSIMPCVAALGHRRLSILDLSPAGHQPLCFNDIWITYNGEVYNYVEIRQELEALGHRFNSQTDTEVILHAYQEWNQDFLQKLNGMFAFVLYDLKKQKVLAVRDRFGVKPLYYWISNDFLALASEIKQFTALPGWNPKIHGQSAYDFLNWGLMDHTSNTLFSEVKQVRGGELLEFNPLKLNVNDLQPKKWYSLTAQPFQGTLQDASKQFRELLENSIKLRLRADVDVGSCLSGGLDSSSIVCLANKFLREQHVNNRQKTFSACSAVNRFDERAFVEIVVQATAVDAHYVYPSLDHVFEECLDTVWHQDEPFTSTSMMAQWLVFKKVKEKNVKVMLDGQGADEQLAGYHGFFGNRFYDLFCSLRWKTLSNEMKGTSLLHSIKPLPLLVNKLLPDPIRQSCRQWLGKSATKPSWLNVSLLDAQDRDPCSSIRNKTVQQQSQLQITQTSLPMLLHFEDRNSMAHSIESRTPFLDYRLVEFSLGLPSDFKIANGWTKRVLRESMQGILPEPIRQRIDKIGFATAEEEWIKKENPQRFLQEVDQAIACSQGILHPSSKKWVEEMILGRHPFSFLPWRMISFGHWLQRFSVKIS